MGTGLVGKVSPRKRRAAVLGIILVAALAAVTAMPSVVFAASGGSAWTWGSNFSGQLGNGSPTNSSSPVEVSMPTGVTFSAIAGGEEHSLTLDSSGQAWAWGSNVSGELGNGSTSNSSSPVEVSMPTGVTFSAIAGGSFFSLALDSSGQAWAWGFNRQGQLGNGTMTLGSRSPVKVSMPTGVTFIAIAAGGGFSLALDSSGQAWAWGENPFGELGNGTTSNSSIPVPVSMPTGVTFSMIAAGGGHSLALDSSGQAWAWGENFFGQLGNGTLTFSSSPTKVSMPAAVTFSAIAGGGAHSLALDSSGQAWSWGDNADGELGNGTTAFSSIPAKVSMPTGVNFSAIAGGGQHSLALDSDGQAWAWGYNFFGELGNGTNTNSSTPVAVTMPTGVTFTAIAAGSYHSLALALRLADLSITKTGSPDPVMGGSQLTYTIAVTNRGDLTATGVTVTDPLPASVHFNSMSSSQGNCTRTVTTKPKTKDGTVSCSLGSLTGGSSATITIVVTPTTAGTLTNTASVTMDQTDPTPADDISTATTTVV